VGRARVVVLVAAAIVVAAAIAWWAWPRDTPETRIRAQLARLARAVHVDPAESPLARRARIGGELEEVLSKEVVYDVDEPSLPGLGSGSGRGALADLATQAAAAWTDADVDLSDVRVTVAPSLRSATVDATATLAGTRRDGSGSEHDRRDVTFELRLIDGEWRVSAIHVSARRE